MQCVYYTRYIGYTEVVHHTVGSPACLTFLSCKNGKSCTCVLCTLCTGVLVYLCTCVLVYLCILVYWYIRVNDYTVTPYVSYLFFYASSPLTKPCLFWEEVGDSTTNFVFQLI